MKAQHESNAIAVNYCGALRWVKLGGTAQPVVPWVAVKYLAIFLACFLALVAIIEFRLATLAKQGQVVSDDWQSENEAINRMNHVKVKSDGNDPVWRSEGIPLPGVKNGNCRILVVGDSFVWGDGYSNVNDIWWRQLERELLHRGYEGIEVVAAGLNGASTQDQLHWLRDLELMERLDPDLVVLGYVTNDPDTKDAQGHYYVKQIGRDVRIPRWRGLDRTLGLAAPHLAMQLKQQLTRKWESRLTDAYPYGEWERKLLEPPNLDAYRSVVLELGEFIRRTRTPFFAVTLPNSPQRDYFEARYHPIAPIFAAAGLPFHNLVDDFVRAYPSDGAGLKWGINPANGHPGRASTRFYARDVGDILERDFPDLLGPKTVRRRVEPSINDWMPPDANVRRVGIGQWELVYPEAGALAPRLPLGKPHVVLAFAEPVAIRGVKVSGARLRASELHLASVDPAAGVERKELQALGPRNGDDAVWQLSGVPGADHVNTLRLAAQFDAPANDAKARTLKVHIEFGDNRVRP
jgi:hypothetical protein